MALGNEIDKLDKVDQQLKDARAVVSELEKQKSEQEGIVFKLMDEQETKQAVGTRTNARVTIKAATVPDVKDWDKLLSFIHRNKAYHLLQRRTSVTAFRELFGIRKRPIPGVEQFEKKSLSLTHPKV